MRGAKDYGKRCALWNPIQAGYIYAGVLCTERESWDLFIGPSCQKALPWQLLTLCPLSPESNRAQHLPLRVVNACWYSDLHILYDFASLLSYPTLTNNSGTRSGVAH